MPEEKVVLIEAKEGWSWLKFLKGPFDGKNYAKALVLGLCQLVVLSLIACVVFTVVQVRGCGKQQSETRIGTNTGTVAQSDNHSVINETHYHLPLSDFLNLFQFRKIQKDKEKNA